MFDILKEAINPEFVRLTSIQKAILLNCFLAETPTLAYEVASGDIYLIKARDFLARASLLEVGESRIKVTSAGYEVLLANGLISGMDEVTEQGTELLNWFEEELKQLHEATIPYRTLRSF